jgi:hypothetical protein
VTGCPKSFFILPKSPPSTPTPAPISCTYQTPYPDRITSHERHPSPSLRPRLDVALATAVPALPGERSPGRQLVCPEV